MVTTKETPKDKIQKANNQNISSQWHHQSLKKTPKIKTQILKSISFSEQKKQDALY